VRPISPLPTDVHCIDRMTANDSQVGRGALSYKKAWSETSENGWRPSCGFLSRLGTRRGAAAMGAFTPRPQAGTDQALWTSTVLSYVWLWDAAGILVSTELPGSDRAPASWWLVNPVTGAATQQVPSSHASLLSLTPLAGDPTDFSFNSLGVDAEGHMMDAHDPLFFAPQQIDASASSCRGPLEYQTMPSPFSVTNSQ
jgi:hypothetical protein